MQWLLKHYIFLLYQSFGKRAIRTFVGCRARNRTWVKGFKVLRATSTQRGNILFYRFTGAEGRGRTDTRVASQQFLRLSRLPIPPLRLNWSGRRDSNSRHPPWQGGILPLNYFRPLYYSNVFYWCRRRDLNPHRLSPTTPSRWRVYQLPPLRQIQGLPKIKMAGVAGFEPATDGFGDHCSTN